MDCDDELEGEEFDPNIYDLRVIVKPPIPPRPSQAALDAAAQRTRQRKRLQRLKKPVVPRRPFSQNLVPSPITWKPLPQVTNEQMEIATFAKAIANKLVAKSGKNSASLMFKRFGNSPTSELWHMVISEFEHRFSNSIRCECAIEQVYSHWSSNANTSHTYELYLFMSMVLVGEEIDETIQRLLSFPFPKQTIPMFCLGKVCRFAAPAVFTSVMSREMDTLLQNKHGLTDTDWLHLLSMATQCIQEFISAILGKLVIPQFVHSSSDSNFAVSNKPEFLIRERVQCAINGVFHVGLKMFYHEVFGAKDRVVASKLEELALEKPTFASLACKFGVKPSTAEAFNDDVIALVFGEALFNSTSPIAHLDALIQACDLFSTGVFGGDGFLSLFITAVCFASIKRQPENLKLATFANMLDEFGLTEDLKGGQGGYIVSCLLTAVEAISQL